MPDSTPTHHAPSSDTTGRALEAPGTSARKPAAACRARVLVVDDDASARRFIRAALERLGFLVCEAANGVQALRGHGAFDPDIVLLDVFMPEMDGLEVLQRLRNSGCRARVIAISGGASSSTESCLYMASHLGASRTLTKPFSIDELSAALAQP